MSTTPTIETEIVAPEEQAQLTAIVQQNALPAEAALSLQSSFAPAFTEARTILQQSRNITVTDASQKLQIKLASEYRKALKAIRVGADKTRKDLKDESLRRSRAIDGMFNILLHLTETEENRLEAQEKFAEVQEAKRQEALKVQRTEILVGINADPSLYSLGQMSEETFQQLVEGVKLARAAAAERARKEEADRIAREAADLAERERVRLENERLKKEADEKEAALKIERERVAAQEREAAEERERQSRLHAEQIDRERVAAQREREAGERQLAEQKRVNDEAAAAAAKKATAAKKLADENIRKEKEAREKVEAELQKQRDAEIARKAAEVEAAKKAAAAPDRDKLLNYANAIRALEIPLLSTAAGQSLANVVGAQRDKLVAWIDEKAMSL